MDGQGAEGAGSEEEDEYGSQYEDMGVTGGLSGFAGAGGQGDLPRRRRKKKKKKKKKPVEYEDPSLREHLLAGAYGGVAKPKPKRMGVKYTTNLDAGLRDIATPASGFMRDTSKANMQASYSGFAGMPGAESSRGRKHHPGRNRSSYGRSEGGS